MSQTPFRFAVGLNGKPKSSVWDCAWTQCDLYLMVRNLMGDRKISFHASGLRTYAFNKNEKAEAARRRSGYPGQTRRICQWCRPSKDNNEWPGIVRELDIIVPTEDLSRDVPYTDGKPITIFPPAGDRTITDITVFMPRDPCSTARLSNCIPIGPGCLSYQHVRIEGGFEASLNRFRGDVLARVGSTVLHPPHWRVISEPVPFADSPRHGHRIVYDLGFTQRSAK